MKLQEFLRITLGIAAEDFEVIRTMGTQGGGFVQALAEAFYRADPANFAKLKAAFPEYWETYAEISRRPKNDSSARPADGDGQGAPPTGDRAPE